MKPQTEDAKKTLILVHRRELVQQAVEQCRRAYPDKSIEIEMGDISATGAADITIASVQSLIRARLLKYQPESFKLILVDEAHHIVAPGYLAVLGWFGLDQSRNTGPALVGVSATFSRFDGLRLGAAIDHIVYHKDYVDMIGERWLSDVMFTTVKSKADLSEVRLAQKHGDFSPSSLSRAMNTQENNEILVKAYKAIAGDRKSTLVFCADISHCRSLSDVFARHGIKTEVITSQTKSNYRAGKLDDFRRGECPVLINCGVFTEGTDIPNIDCVILARPTKSRNLLVQMIGRGMRLYSGKENCHVIDFVGSLEAGIVTVPTLLGLDPGEITRETTVDDMKLLKRRKEEEEAAMGVEERNVMLSKSESNVANNLVTFTHYDTVQDLIDDTSGERHVRQLSPNAWVEIDFAKYILSPKGGVLTIEKCDAIDLQFKVSYRYELPPSVSVSTPYSRVKDIARASTLSDAVHAADTYANKVFHKFYIRHTETWRKSPASESQLRFLNKFRVDQELLTPEQVNKGRAGDMITKIRFGARGRFDRAMAKNRKVQKETAKLEMAEELRKREHVQVGPLN